MNYDYSTLKHVSFSFQDHYAISRIHTQDEILLPFFHFDLSKIMTFNE